MLPPLNLLALEALAVDADLKTWHGVQAQESGFSTTFSEMRRSPLSANPVLPELLPDAAVIDLSSLVVGGVLPHPGKALPLPEPDADWNLTAGVDASAVISEVPGLPGAVTELRGAVELFVAPPGSMHAQRLPAERTGMPDAASAAVIADAESGSEPAARTGQATIPGHLRHAPPEGARALAEIVTVDPAAEAGNPAPPHRNPSAIRDAGLLQQFVQQVADPVPARAGGQPPADALPQVDIQDARAAPSSATPSPFASGGTAASSSPTQWVASQVHTAPGQPGWSDALGERVTWMTGNKLQNVELRLNPAELGPVRVQISIDDGNATVNFSAQHPLTRDAIEQALPRLREMLADQGLSLQDANVSEGGGKDQPGTGRHEDFVRFASEGASSGPPTDDSPVPSSTAHTVGLVDLFA
jgi:flagellar hook-length control protein FliK